MNTLMTCRISGDHKRGVPPVPIPNTDVKALAADGSETIGLVRVGCCQIYDPDVPKGYPGLFLYPPNAMLCDTKHVDC